MLLPTVAAEEAQVGDIHVHHHHYFHRRRHLLIRRLVKDFETNAAFQFRFHLVMMLVWIFFGAVGPVILIMLPGLWLKVGVLFVYELSIYANWDTDYDAVSASMAARHGEELLARRVSHTEVSEVIVDHGEA